MSEVDNQANGIAVIGLAGRFPKAKNIEAFWRNLTSGIEAISFFSDEELRQGGTQIPADASNYVKARGVLEDAANFDADFFGMNPREAEITDPQHRLFLECAWEALEDGGYAGKRGDRMVGVYGGMSMNTYLLANLYSRPDVMDLAGPYPIMLGNDKDYLPTRVSYKLNLRGPGVNVQTACSTSLVAVCFACEQLLNYQCDMALAGGVSVTFPQKRGYVYQEGGISSPDGHCRAFDANARGTVAGDGVGIVLLKRVAEALQDGDHIYAVIKGFATNNDGSLKAGFTAPSPDGQAEVIALAQAVAGISPESIGYVVAHGTGTPLGDPIEVEGLTKAFRAGTDARQFCALTSVKPNIGHLDAAAGIAGLINAILAVYHGQIPPNLHFQEPNPKINFESSPFFVNRKLRDWVCETGPRRAGVSSFGIGGTNAHVIVEEPPQPSPPLPDPGSSLLLLTARTTVALNKATEQLAAHFENNDHDSIADAAYTLAVGRAEFEERRAIVCRERVDAITALRTLDPNQVISGKARTKPAVAFMFPGQGAQYVNMGVELYRTERVFREQVDGCTEILQSHLGFDLRDILYPKTGGSEEASQRLMQTAAAQPALFTVEYALAKLWLSWGIEPQSLIGHSIGEYAAACLAGVFSLRDGLGLVALRGSLMQRMPPGAMLAVRLPESEIKSWLSEEVSLAALNSPGNCVLSGPEAAIDELAEKLRKGGVAGQRLHTSHAFHSAMMDPIRNVFAQAVQRIHLRSPRVPYLSNLTGTWITAEQATSPAYWADHLRQTVRFADGLTELLRPNELVLLECGPGRTLSTFAKQHPDCQPNQPIAASLPRAKADEADDYWAILHAAGKLWIAGVDIDWQSFYGKDRRRRVSLPTYPFDRKRYWVEPGQPASTRIAGTVNPAEAEAPDSKPTAATNRLSPPAGNEVIAASLKALFSRLSGLSADRIDSRISFTELGFDSLFLTQASQAIEKQFGVKVPFGQLLEKFSTLELLTTHIGTAGRTTADDQARKGASVNPETPSLAGVSNRAPLTEAQKEIWYAAQHSDDASCVFNESNFLKLKGPLDIELLRRSIQQVVDRHESLRTTFSRDGDFQEVQAPVSIEVPLLNWSAKSEVEQRGSFDGLLQEAARTPFDLTKGPLHRWLLIQMKDQHHVLLFTVHHLVCDGASLGILLNEISEIYSAARRGTKCEFAPAARFVDYAQRQFEQKKSPEKIASEQFWLEQFRTLPPPLDLPVDFARSREMKFSGGWEYRLLDPQLCRELSRWSAQQKCTLFQTFLASYYLLLYQLTGQQEIVVGVPAAERSPGSEKLVGHCINFLPLRNQFQPQEPFAGFLSRLKSSLLEALKHQNYTFGTLVQKLKLPRDRSRPPLVSATFNMVWVRRGLSFAGLEVDLEPNPMSFTNFDLTFNVTEMDGTFSLDCSFRSDLWRAARVQEWMADFEALLQHIVAEPEGSLVKLAPPKDPRAKTDYPRIPAPAQTLVEPQAAVAPRTPTEKLLENMWCEVIGVDEVGVHDNFFDLGGHSVLLTHIVGRIRQTFGVDMGLRSVFERPTIAGVAEIIEALLVEEIGLLSEEEANRLSAEPALMEREGA